MKLCLDTRDVTIEEYSMLNNTGWNTRVVPYQNGSVLIATKREQQYEYSL